MKIKNLTITSPSTLDLKLDITSPVCVLCGEYSDLALDLLRELIGDYGAENDPDRFDDGHFVIHSDIEMDGKNYQVCYIRSADFLGDNRIAANFVPNSLDFSTDDTIEFMKKCGQRDKDRSNVLCGLAHDLNKEDDRPIFVYNLDKIDDATAQDFLDALADSGRQVFVAVCFGFDDVNQENVQMYSV